MKRALPALLALCLCLAACGEDRGQLAGRYTATAQAGHIFLTLREDGGGEWQAGGESVQFRWERRDGEIWLHARGGGVLAGRLQPGGLEMELPQAGRLLFHRE